MRPETRSFYARAVQRVGPGPSFEIYRNTPMDVPKEKLVTDLYVSIE
jgi:DNA gyrase inhibitor GyrI